MSVFPAGPVQDVSGSTWGRLLAPLHAAGVPILDPRFVPLVAQLCVPHVDLEGRCSAVVAWQS
jgi:hypothetical protein